MRDDIHQGRIRLSDLYIRSEIFDLTPLLTRFVIF